MRRLSLDAFKAQKQLPQTKDQLLDQILGDCHDNTSSGKVNSPSTAASMGSGSTGI